MDNKGTTITEVLISIFIIAIVVVFLCTLLVQIHKEDNVNTIESTFLLEQATLTKAIEEDIVNYGVKSISGCTLDDALISGDTLVKGYEDNYTCVKIKYDDEYLDSIVGFVLIYNYYTKYQKQGDAYKGIKSSWIIEYIRGNYKSCLESDKITLDTWENTTTLMKELPDSVIVNKPYINYSAGNGNNAASLVIPIEDSKGEHYDLNLSFTFKGNDEFKCNNLDFNCNCKSNDIMCNKTYNYTNTCN